MRLLPAFLALLVCSLATAAEVIGGQPIIASEGTVVVGTTPAQPGGILVVDKPASEQADEASDTSERTTNEPQEGDTGILVGRVESIADGNLVLLVEGQRIGLSPRRIKGAADPAVLKQIARVAVGDQVRVAWIFERFRCITAISVR